jgi:hypothetical protein
MPTIHRLIVMFAVGWGGVTAVLILILIHRSILQDREQDQLYLDPAERSLAAEQKSVVARIEKLAWPIGTLSVVSAMLLVATVAMWLWQGLARP